MYYNKLINQGIATRGALDSIDERELALIEEAVRFMEGSPFPDPANLEAALWHK